jgi:hypothetical protein
MNVQEEEFFGLVVMTMKSYEFMEQACSFLVYEDEENKG